jgi:hypothetical protein
MRRNLRTTASNYQRPLDASSDRRGFFGRVAAGIHGAALASLLGRESRAAELFGDLRARPPRHDAKARAVIHLFMNGGPSQMDLFDPKPALDRHHGEAHFEKIAAEVENPNAAGALMRSPFRFARHGRAGMWVSDALPQLSRHVDEIALVLSMHTTSLTHEPAVYAIHTGKLIPGAPTLGSWVTYGLGTHCDDLPAYVVLDDPRGLPVGGVENWQSGYLPPVFQGTRFRSVGSPVLNLRRERGEPEAISRIGSELLSALDDAHRRERPRRPSLDARIESYELAARMQIEASDALDISKESAATLEAYGIGSEPTDSYGRRCLMARRLVERGVRFVQLFLEGQIWDNHTTLARDLRQACARTDRPIAALLEDLGQRGLLDETLVVWGGEFGRLPIAQLSGDRDDSNAGRDHNKNAFSTWFAGAGIRGGTTWGSTDELGFRVVENPVSVPDWHATILHLLGFDHEEIFVERNGFEEKLTSIFDASVIRGILA